VYKRQALATLLVQLMSALLKLKARAPDDGRLYPLGLGSGSDLEATLLVNFMSTLLKLMLEGARLAADLQPDVVEGRYVLLGTVREYASSQPSLRFRLRRPVEGRRERGRGVARRPGPLSMLGDGRRVDRFVLRRLILALGTRPAGSRTRADLRRGDAPGEGLVQIRMRVGAARCQDRDDQQDHHQHADNRPEHHPAAHPHMIQHTLEHQVLVRSKWRSKGNTF